MQQQQMKRRQNYIEYLDYRKPNRERKRRQQIVHQQKMVQYQDGGMQIKEKVKIEPEINIKGQQSAVMSIGMQVEGERELPNIQKREQMMQIENEDREIINLLEDSSNNDQIQIEVENITKQLSRSLGSCKITLSMKHILDYPNTDVLFIPYITSQLQYYPGDVFRERLAVIRDKLSKLEIVNGGGYIKNKHGIQNFQLIFFLKVNISQFSKNLADGLNLFLKKTKSDKIPINRILFCVQKGMQIPQILKGLSKSSQLKCNQGIELLLNVKDQERYKEQYQQLNSLVPQ